MPRKRGNGEGSIFYNEKTNRWIGQFVAGLKDDGTLNRKTVYGKTRKEVTSKIQSKLSEVKENRFVEKTNITLSEIMLETIEDKLNFNRISEASYTRLMSTMKQIEKSNVKIYDMPIRKITIQQLKRFFAEQTHYSNSIIAKIYMCINGAFKTAMRRKYINENPMEIGEIPRPKSDNPTKKVEALTIEEHQKLLEAFKVGEREHEYKNPILLMLYSGMRAGEVLALDKDTDIDLKNNRIHIRRTLTINKENKCVLGSKTKTYNSLRSIEITDALKRILNDVLYNWEPNKENLLFWDYKNNEVISPSEITSYLQRLNKLYGITTGLHCHMLRHTYATRCIEAGVPAVVLQKKLGHKDVSITLNTYTSVFDRYVENFDHKWTDYLEKQSLVV